MDKESADRRWESGTLAHGVPDPFGQGPLPWLRSPDQYLAGTEGAIPWYVSTDAPGQQPLPAAPPAPLVGTPRNSDDVVQQIKGFASAGPVYPGGSVDLRVTVHPPRDFLVDIYRIGHDAGAGAQHMTASPLIAGLQQPSPLVVDRTVSCHHWWHSWRQQIPAHWRPGAYVAVLTTADQRHRSHVPFTVRDQLAAGPADTGPAADLLLVLPDITWQAYNLFPEDGHTGASLYHAWDGQGRLLGESQAAVTVSFDRPHAGAGLPLHVGHAYDFIRWAERYGYDLAYATASDLHAGLVEPSRHRALIFPGHDEYWSEPMRRTVERARDGGTSLIFLSANTMYWRVDLTSGASGEPGRLLNCRKRQRVPADSPAAGPAGAASALWRDAGSPSSTCWASSTRAGWPSRCRCWPATPGTGSGPAPGCGTATRWRTWWRARPTATSPRSRCPRTASGSCSPTRPTRTSGAAPATRRPRSTGHPAAPTSSPPAPSPGRPPWIALGTPTNGSRRPPPTCSTRSARTGEPGRARGRMKDSGCPSSGPHS